MAALLLSVAGGAVGGALFGPVGAIAGRIVGAIGGNIIDRALLGGGTQYAQGPRLADLDVMASTEGAPIPRVYGRVRVAGQVIWATQLEEVISTSVDKSGGKGGVGATKTVTTTYSYFANFAVGLCEGTIAKVGRIWADGKLLDLANVTYRVYPGSETQTADSLIVAKDGDAPAYRGLAYIVFERLPLANFGNRIPQLSFEVIRPVGRLEQMVRAVTLIPGTTEFGYEPGTTVQILGPGQSTPENRHIGHAASDVDAALDELQAICPALERVAIVVPWFGNDLRAAHCTLMPGVEVAEKTTSPQDWSAAGLTRAGAHLVSTVGGRPAYGGTPDDISVIDLIGELKSRGLKVTLYPFVVMDIPAGNALPNPWTGEATQWNYPWRGRITCDPARGQAGSPDGTSTAATQVNAFFGSAAPGDFSLSGRTVVYGGPAEWTYRRLVLHCAWLAKAAGGVDAFLIGSELRSLTRVRSASGVYPAVTALASLAADVKTVLGGDTIVTYGADWTEYGAHVVDPAANEVRFPLDALWASSSIDAVGIDYYAPLADWRDGADHLDRALTNSTYELAYLAGNFARGEAYDFYYADDAARNAQTRTPITDGLGKPWVFRVKDVWSWWSNAHVERVGGVETSATAWVPQGKPIWLTEIGCPAVDKGANQPSVFPDPKSIDSGVPYFSNGRRDDFIQRRMLEAALTTFDPAFGASDAANPVSTVYHDRMVEPTAIHLWTWDARPYPEFPAALDIWSDGANWETGHWLTGRLGSAPLDTLVGTILSDAGVTGCDTTALTEVAEGYLIDRPMAPRDAIEPIAAAYAFDAAEDAGVLTFRPRGGTPVADIAEDDLVLPDDGAPARLTRAQETELPREVSIAYTDSGSDYRRAAVMSRRLTVGSTGTAHADLAVVTNNAAAERRAEIWLQDLWAGREAADFALPPSRLALGPGDVVGLTVSGRRRLIELREVVDTESRAIKAQSIDPDVFDLPLDVPRRRAPAVPPAFGPAYALVLDLPALTDDQPVTLAWLAVFADPWRPMAVWQSADGLSYTQAALAQAPAVMGETLDDLPAGPTSRWDWASSARARLYGGALASASDANVLNGANVAAVRRADGAWEVLQFANADLVDTRTYRLSRFLRGQRGSEWAMGDPLPAGSPFVVLDTNVIAIAQGINTLERTMPLRVVAADRDHGDASAVDLTVTPTRIALEPLSSVHLRASRSGAGVAFDWMRRKRGTVPAAWSVTAPLGEDTEAYEVDILSGSSVVRTLSSSGPSVLYAAADEFADFGSPQTNLSVRAYQLSATVGRGIAGAATLNP